jgi:cation diffusion facilitator family transporter
MASDPSPHTPDPDIESAEPLAQENAADFRALKFAMTLSLLVGLFMLLIKVTAYLLTGSAAVLSDAAESVVHVAAVSFAFYSLQLSRKPADPGHLYGHAKISYFSAGFEGAMIILAALYIIFEAARKWIFGLELDHLGLGTLLTALAMAINAALGAYLLHIGRKKNSIILTANGKHVLTDFWTSLGVLVGLGLALLTGWLPWDPIAAILVALNILWSGIGLIRQSIGGLMDVADPRDHQSIVDLLERETERHGIRYHDLRHRSLGDAVWVDVHLLFPESTPVGEAHRVATLVEQAFTPVLLRPTHVTTHLEALEDHHVVHPSGDGGATPG